MQDKKIGIILLAACLVLGAFVASLNGMVQQSADAQCSCVNDGTGTCPHQETTPWQTYAAAVILSAVGALGLYLVFFERSRHELLRALGRDRRISHAEERFTLLLKGLDEYERKVMQALWEQDGITQYTLRLRTGLHKSKLSVVLEGLEEKELIAREAKGKTKKVFIKVAL